jgi:hypothetical protein
MKDVAALKNLKDVSLNGTKITDAGLTELARVQSLQSLSLKGTKVTKAGIAALQKALPECKIQ